MPITMTEQGIDSPSLHRQLQEVGGAGDARVVVADRLLASGA
jgi:hypothetical protein